VGAARRIARWARLAKAESTFCIVLIARKYIQIIVGLKNVYFVANKYIILKYEI
jgi:hypothetical protein